MKEYIIVKTGKDKYKLLSSNKYTINRNTPVGEPADFYEIRPWGGKKPIYPLVFITEIDEKIKIDWYAYKIFNYDKKEWVLSDRTPESLIKFVEDSKSKIYENKSTN